MMLVPDDPSNTVNRWRSFAIQNGADPPFGAIVQTIWQNLDGFQKSQ